MKIINFIIFLSIILIIYGSVNYYIFIRGWQSIPDSKLFKSLYLIIFLVISFSFFLGRILEKFFMNILSGSLIWIGSIWLGMMLYLFLAIVFIDILRLANSLINFFPMLITHNYKKAKLVTAIIVIAAASITVFAGYINTLNPILRTLNIKIQKNGRSLKKLNIILVSDIHMGTIIGNSRINNLVRQINRVNPDIVLLAGDIVDEDPAPIIKKNLGEKLKTIKTKYGSYAITGNHEYIGGVKAASKYLTEHGIILLRDSVIKINNSFYLAGREDLTVNRLGVKRRKPLHKMLEGIDKSYPVIIMDHQPFNLKEAVNNGIDLQLSGHTHHGQLWPLNYITGMIYELDRGYKKINNTHFYVSSGFGTWGPPVRVGTRPEIVNIILRFN